MTDDHVVDTKPRQAAGSTRATGSTTTIATAVQLDENDTIGSSTGPIWTSMVQHLQKTKLPQARKADKAKWYSLFTQTNFTTSADTRYGALNRQLSAKAFTTGQDIFFRQGAYDPGSSAGQQLIAHELTHVVQQSTGLVSRGQKMTVRPAGDAYEQEADAVTHAAAGAGAQVQRQVEEAKVQTQALQRQEEEEEVQTQLVQRQEELPEEEV